jgi:hypothetical protein
MCRLAAGRATDRVVSGLFACGEAAGRLVFGEGAAGLGVQGGLVPAGLMCPKCQIERATARVRQIGDFVQFSEVGALFRGAAVTGRRVSRPHGKVVP